MNLKKKFPNREIDGDFKKMPIQGKGKYRAQKMQEGSNPDGNSTQTHVDVVIIVANYKIFLGSLAKKSKKFLRFLSTIFKNLAKSCEPCQE